MQGCAMLLGDGRVSGIWLCSFHSYAPTRRFVVFTLYAGGQVIGFMVSLTPCASTHMGSLRIVEFQVPSIMEDHGSVLKSWRLVLSAAFVSFRFIWFCGCLVG